MSIAYLDSSSLIKLVNKEPETAALRKYLRSVEVRVSSQLARAEVLRTARVLGGNASRVAKDVLGRVRLLSIDAELLERSAVIDPPTLRTLDAIHLASALSFGSELDELVTYDKRMLSAAQQLGITVSAPS